MARAMLTIFSIPKPFSGHVGLIQRNAIRSWTLLEPHCEVVLLGDDEGTAQAAAETGVRHLPQVATTDRGTPLVSDAFERVRREASFPLLCFVNSDVVLTRSLLDAVVRLHRQRYLLVGQRLDLDVREPIDFGDSAWEQTLLARVVREGWLHPAAGSDYFVFQREIDWKMPPFAVGRAGWDNWLIQRARQLRIPVVDASPLVRVVHQEHDYAHLTAVEDGGLDPESRANVELGGGGATLFDASHVLTRRGLAPALMPRHLSRRLRVPWLGPALQSAVIAHSRYARRSRLS